MQKKQHFSVLGYLRLSCAQPTGNSFTPNQWYRWKAETPEVCLLLVWRVCEQAFGRYRPLKGADKWSRDHHENLHIDTCRKIHRFQNAILFDLRRYRAKPFPNSGVTRRLAVLNWRSSSIHASSLGLETVRMLAYLLCFWQNSHSLGIYVVINKYVIRVNKWILYEFCICNVLWCIGIIVVQEG